MRQKLVYLICIFSLLSCNKTQKEISIFEEQALFTNGVGGYACYRIPAIVSSKEGILLAFVEGRVKDCGDFGNVDLLLTTSSDKGKTWSTPTKIIDCMSSNEFELFRSKNKRVFS